MKYHVARPRVASQRNKSLSIVWHAYSRYSLGYTTTHNSTNIMCPSFYGINEHIAPSVQCVYKLQYALRSSNPICLHINILSIEIYLNTKGLQVKWAVAFYVRSRLFIFLMYSVVFLVFLTK